MEKATLILTRYKESDAEVVALINRLKSQDTLFDILFYDQRKSQAAKKAVETIDGKYEAITEAPLGEIRNRGIAHATTDIIVFTDIDVDPSNQWIGELAATFQNYSSVGIVGGRIVPRFEMDSESYRWLLRLSGFVRSLYGEFDLPACVWEVKKVYGGCLALHKGRLGEEAYFKHHLGRQGGRLIGGEDTDLCQRCRAKGYKIAYNSSALVYHLIPASKMSIEWIASGVFYKGFTRAYREDSVFGAGAGMSVDLLDPFVIPFSLPLYSMGYLWGKKEKRSRIRVVDRAPAPTPPRISKFTRRKNALATVCRSLFYRRKEETIHIEKILVGQQAGFQLRKWVILTGEVERFSVPVTDSPYVSFLRDVQGNEELLRDDGFLEGSAYFKMAETCIAATGRFMGATNDRQLKGWMREYYAMYKRMERGASEGSKATYSRAQGHSDRGSPITLRRVGDCDKYEVIDGHHRLAISYMMKNTDIPAVVMEKRK